MSNLHETEVGDQFTSLEALIGALARPDCGLARVRGSRIRSGELLGWLETQASLDSVQRARIQALFKRLGTNPSLLLFALRYTLTPDSPLELGPGVTAQSPAELGATLLDTWPDIESPFKALGTLAASGRLTEWLRACEPLGWEEVAQKIEFARTRHPDDLELPGWLLLWAYSTKSPFPFNGGLVETPAELARAIDASDLSRQEGLRLLDAGWIRAWLIATGKLADNAAWDATAQDTETPPTARLAAALIQLDPDRPAPVLRATPVQLDFGTLRRDEQRQLELRLHTQHGESVACNLSLQDAGVPIALNVTHLKSTPATIQVSVGDRSLAAGHRVETAILVHGSGAELRVPVRFRVATSETAIGRRFSPAVILVLLAIFGGLGWWAMPDKYHPWGPHSLGNSPFVKDQGKSLPYDPRESHSSSNSPPNGPTGNGTQTPWQTGGSGGQQTVSQNTGETAYVNTILLNVRDGPGPDYASLTRVPQGTPIRVLERRSVGDNAIWARIEFQGVSGWVNAKLLSTAPVAPSNADSSPPEAISQPISTLSIPNDGGTAYVNTILLNIRNGPGPEYASVAKAPQGTPVRVLGRRSVDDDALWAKITFQGVSGRVNAKLLSANPVAPSNTASTSSINVINPLRKSPSFNCASAARKSESTICRDSALAALDNELAALYRSRNQGLSGESAKSFRDNQRLWIAKRDKCGSDAGCLTNRYREQIIWLKNFNGGTTATSSDARIAMRVNSPRAGFLALRSEPSTQSGFRVDKIPHGTELILGDCITTPTKDHWCKTRYLGKTGWILERYLKR